MNETVKQPTILEQGQKFAKNMTTPVETGKKGSASIAVENDKVKFGVGRKFETSKIEGEIGAEVEMEKDQKPNYKVGGRINWE